MESIEKMTDVMFLGFGFGGLLVAMFFTHFNVENKILKIKKETDAEMTALRRAHAKNLEELDILRTLVAKHDQNNSELHLRAATAVHEINQWRSGIELNKLR
jgi:hypothetical protein